MTHCKSEDSSTKDKMPEACQDAAAYAVHAHRKAKFASLAKTMNGAIRRMPMESGEAVKSDEVLGITLHYGSDGFIFVHAYFSKTEHKTFIEVQSDAIDPCYFGLSYGEYEFSDEQMNLLNSALNQTKRVEGKPVECPSNRMGSNFNLVRIYYNDSTFATYLVNRPGACYVGDEESLPLISEDFFRKQYEIRSTITDESSPY
jgi:hypothetical protein